MVRGMGPRVWAMGRSASTSDVAVCGHARLRRAPARAGVLSLKGRGRGASPYRRPGPSRTARPRRSPRPIPSRRPTASAGARSARAPPGWRRRGVCRSIKVRSGFGPPRVTPTGRGGSGLGLWPALCRGRSQCLLGVLTITRLHVSLGVGGTGPWPAISRWMRELCFVQKAALIFIIHPPVTISSPFSTPG